MTTPAPKYRCTYCIQVRHDIPIRGSTTGRSIEHVRGLLAVVYGVEWAELAKIEIVAVEESTNE
jgi:hypothetical protein